MKNIRTQFPILEEQIHGKPLIYFDNAATTQKPVSVIARVSDYYACENANIHRGTHSLANKATNDFENVRKQIADFIHAAEKDEIIFTSGTTDSINLVAHSFGQEFISEGDEIIISEMEHHSNIVPWQLMAEERRAVIKVIPVTDSGELDMDAFKKLLSPKTKLVSVAHVSNTLGTINPIKKIITIAHDHQIPVLIDGAQAIAHMPVDVQKLDCDFYAFSGHKMYGPTGVGVLYGKRKLLEKIPPYRGGGEMITSVTFEKTTYNEIPFKFEAGTPNIAGVLGLEAALSFIQSLKFAHAKYEDELLTYAAKKLSDIEGVTIIGTASAKIAVISFTVNGIHSSDIGTLLDQQGIAVRTGVHCTEPLMKRFGIKGTVRISFAAYNTKEEIDIFIGALQKSITMLNNA